MLYFKLFACVQVTKGIKNTIVIDLQHEKMISIDSSLNKYLSKRINYSKLCENNDKSKKIQKQNKKLKEFLDYFIDNGWGFLTDQPDSFPKLNLEYNYFAHISNLIIDIISYEEAIHYNIIASINSLLVQAIQFRIFCEYDEEKLSKLIKYYFKSDFNSLELILQYDSNTSKEKMESLLQNHIRLSKIYVVNSDEDKIIEFKNKIIIYSTKQFKDCTYCGNINMANFRGNLLFYTESLKNNTCLNKKISIDIDGNIKNCPSMQHSFGNIKDTLLEDVIEIDEFKKYWNLSKNEILVCKDCEYRNVCTDCRAYLEDPTNIFSKPLKCGYSPYTGEWTEWSTNPIKLEAMKSYKLHMLSE